MVIVEKKLLYLQIKEGIEKDIKEGVLKPGDKLPSEPELAKIYAVSRPTLREALKMMQREGVLVSKNGVGTFVNNKTAMIENPLNKLQSVGEMIKAAGYQESEADIKIYTRAAEPEWKDQLRVDENVVIIERTRTANGKGVAFYYNILPESMVGEHLNQGFSGAIFRFLETKAGIKITHSITEICAVTGSNERDRRAFKILGREILLLKQLHFDQKNKPVFYSLDYLRNDIFKLFMRREREYFA